SAAGGPGQALVTQVAQRQAHGLFVKVRDRLAIVLLVAGVDERVERERIIIRGGDVLFDQRPQDAGFSGVEDNVHGNNVSGEIANRETVWRASRAMIGRLMLRAYP